MKKLMFLVALVAIFQTAIAQKYITRNGYIRFFSHTVAEDIEGKNNAATSIIDMATGDMVFKALMKSFNFQKALMQEHFNEKYVESEKFPNAELKAKIKEDAEQQFVQQADQQFLNDVTEALLETTQFDLPETFLKKWIQTIGETPLTPEQAEAEFVKSERGLRYQLIESKISY